MIATTRKEIIWISVRASMTNTLHFSEWRNCIRAQRKVNLCAPGAPKGPKGRMVVRQYEILCANDAGRAPRKYPGVTAIYENNFSSGNNANSDIMYDSRYLPCDIVRHKHRGPNYSDASVNLPTPNVCKHARVRIVSNIDFVCLSRCHFEAWTVLFSPICCSSLSCING